MEFPETRRPSGLSRLAVALGTALCASLAVVGADARWLAALGRAIVHAGAVPSGIPYAAAPSHDWANVPVLAELIFHALEAAGGDRGLRLAQVAAIAVGLTLLSRDMRDADASDASRALVLVAIPFAAMAQLVVVRSQLFSLALFPLCLLLVRSEARNPSRRIWLLVPLVALWSNLHGAVLVGLAVAGAYLVLERSRRDPLTAVGVLAASFAALFATPALSDTGGYYLGVLHSEVAARGEGLWAPLSMHKPLDVLFVVVALPLVALAFRSRPRPWEIICLLALAASAVHAGRNSVWLVFFAATPSALALRGEGLRRLVPSPFVLRACALAPVVLLLVGAARTPVEDGAGKALRTKASRLANGSTILADDVDAEKLALDGQRVWIANPIDAFDRVDQRLYLDWLNGDPAGQALLNRVRVVLVRRDSPAQLRLAHNRRFRQAARDDAAVVYVGRALRVSPIAAPKG